MTDISNNPTADLAALLGPQSYKLTPATLANKVTHGQWQPAKHLMYLSGIIAEKLNKGGARLIISLPFRHGKSELSSIWTSIWYLMNNPTHDVMMTAYGKELSSDFGRKVRDIIIEDNDEIEGEHLLDLDVNPNSTNVSRWHTTKGGSMKSVGIGGAVNGRGANLFMVDDYFKNPEEAMNANTRDSIFEWFSSIALTRMAPNGSILVIATRWHKDDLSGRLLALPNSKWEEIRLPVYADKDDPIGRTEGELLWPERYSQDAIGEIQDTMSSFLFSAVMQQSPKESSSDSFKRDWIKVIKTQDTTPANLEGSQLQFERSWDLAGTEGDGDYTVGTLLSRNTASNAVIIHDVIRVQKAPGGVQTLIESTMINDGPHVKVLIEQEPGSSGKAIADGYVSRNPGYAVKTKRSTGNKFTRMEPFFAACEHGRVSMVQASWNDDLLDELVAMPDGKHDDIGDTLSQGYNEFFEKKSKAGVFGRRNKTNHFKSGNVVSGVVF